MYYYYDNQYATEVNYYNTGYEFTYKDEISNYYYQSDILYGIVYHMCEYS